MKRYFNTREKAQTHLDYRRECAYARIENRGDKILRDGSHVYCDAQDNKWKVRMGIWTEQMIKDIEKLESIMYEEDPMALIPWDDQEKLLKVEKLRKMFFQKHKTNETIGDTINKDL